ncbi:sensor histidine kinase [Chloroflexota bacterium]
MTTNMRTKYERQSFLFLSTFRFISYALAVMFTQLPSAINQMNISYQQAYIILGALGVYTLLRIFSPLRWQEKSLMTYIILSGDFLLCILIIIFTNGLSSSFLLYSLTPIMTAALFYEERVALSLAITASFSLSMTYLFLNSSSDIAVMTLVQGQNLTLLIIYSLFSFVTALVPYRINLNIRRRIERDAIIEERRRIGREIHDGVAQTISLLNMKTKMVKDLVSSNNTQEAVAELDEIKEIAQNTYEDIREAIDQLSIESINLPLITTLGNYVKKFGEKNNIKTKFHVSKHFLQLSPVSELQLIRIAQEALTNIRRHAQASKVEVNLYCHGKSVEMIVKDDGQGFTIPKIGGPDLGYYGLSIIKERAEGLGGTLVISSESGKGTEIVINLPREKVRL